MKVPGKNGTHSCSHSLYTEANHFTATVKTLSAAKVRFKTARWSWPLSDRSRQRRKRAWPIWRNFSVSANLPVLMVKKKMKGSIRLDMTIAGGQLTRSALQVLCNYSDLLTGILSIVVVVVTFFLALGFFFSFLIFLSPIWNSSFFTQEKPPWT